MVDSEWWNAESEKIDGVTRRGGEASNDEFGVRNAESEEIDGGTRRDLRTDGETGRNGDAENLKLWNSDCGIQRVRRGDKGIRISGHREK